jgi:hypothetical protein
MGFLKQTFLKIQNFSQNIRTIFLIEGFKKINFPCVFNEFSKGPWKKTPNPSPHTVLIAMRGLKECWLFVIPNPLPWLWLSGSKAYLPYFFSCLSMMMWNFGKTMSLLFQVCDSPDASAVAAVASINSMLGRPGQQQYPQVICCEIRTIFC